MQLWTHAFFSHSGRKGATCELLTSPRARASCRRSWRSPGGRLSCSRFPALGGAFLCQRPPSFQATFRLLVAGRRADGFASTVAAWLVVLAEAVEVAAALLVVVEVVVATALVVRAAAAV